jgi:predicted amidohydrolase
MRNEVAEFTVVSDSVKRGWKGMGQGLMGPKSGGGWAGLGLGLGLGLRDDAEPGRLRSMKSRMLFGMVVALMATQRVDAAEPEAGAKGWSLWSPREEVSPVGAWNEKGGPDGAGSLVMETGEGGHWFGCWKKTLEVEGGGHVRFDAWFRHRGVEVPRRSVVARVLWRDAEGRAVRWDKAPGAGYRGDERPSAEPEYPAVVSGETRKGWGRMSETLEVPQEARQAVVELYLQWAGNARLEWSGVTLEKVAAPPPRKVRLATVHFQPAGGTSAAEKVALFEPLLEEAARQKADLVVLPETLTYYRSGKTLVECAEPVPGPSTDAFGRMAKAYGLHVVAGLVEREGVAVYNVAVLIDPDGKVAGKYRKVCLPRGEIEAGLTPGTEYPVFKTRFGKVGMMVCYDGFFPEVARELSNRGAEVIAWPVWGCNPLLAAARACENHVYVVSSTYAEVATKWMISGIFDHYGRVLAKGEEWGTVVVTEVDLNATTRWNSLGNFGAQLPSHRPVGLGDQAGGLK